MSFKRYSKEEWEKLDQKEKDWAMLEFKKDNELFRRKLLIFSRVIAILFLIILSWIWYTQLTKVQEYSNLRDQYGPKWGCYICGLESAKRCSCVETRASEIRMFYNESYFKDYALRLAKENVESCIIKYNDPQDSNVSDFNISILNNFIVKE